MLNVKAFGLALGILWALSLIILSFTSEQFGYGLDITDFVSQYYIGFDTSIKGTIIGGVWAFADAGICGAVFAWLYNKLCNCKSIKKK